MVARAVAALLLAGEAVWPQPAKPATASLSAADRSSLMAARDAVWRAWFAGDTVQLRRLLPARTLALESGDSVWQTRREQIVAAAADYHARGGRLVELTFPRVEIQVLGDVVVLYSTFRMDTERSGKRSVARGTAVEVFQREGRVWLNPSWYLDFSP
ncbi:MAG TPA: nuclear transport factor 2 family protein [Gemmatimonadaceae bacterium]|nr:nuclear transport factor 2 family protein [Gemmatimonadaceae bacterium]